jgi:hypothetical protein
LDSIGRNRNSGVGMEYSLDTFLHKVGRFLAIVSSIRAGEVNKRDPERELCAGTGGREGVPWDGGKVDMPIWMQDALSTPPFQGRSFTNPLPAQKMESRHNGVTRKNLCHSPAKPSE